MHHQIYGPILIEVCLLKLAQIATDYATSADTLRKAIQGLSGWGWLGMNGVTLGLTGSSEPDKDKYLARMVSADHSHRVHEYTSFLCVTPNLSKDDDEVRNFMELLIRNADASVSRSWGRVAIQIAAPQTSHHTLL